MTARMAGDIGLQLNRHDNILRFSDEKAGLSAIVALHHLRNGKAMGGTRLFPYASEQEGLADALRLSEAMTYKAACAGLPVGGGKAVIIANPRAKTPDLIRAYARFIDSLQGRFVTGQDLNMTVADVRLMAEETSYVVGIEETAVGPALMTARGVLAGMHAAAAHVYQTGGSLAGIRVGIQGVGEVGARLAKLLVEVGAEPIICDLDNVRAQGVAGTLGIRSVAPEEMMDQDIEIYSPCGAGGILNQTSILRLRARIVAGAANNQLANPESDAELLSKRDIVYCPDFVINAGGVIEVYNEHVGYDAVRAARMVEGIGATITEVLELASELQISPHAAAVRVGKSRLGISLEDYLPNNDLNSQSVSGGRA